MKKSRNLLNILAVVLLVIAALAMTLFFTGCTEEENGGGGDSAPATPTYEITFVTNGGPAVANASVKQGEEYVLPTGLTWDGYAFDGWYLSDAFTGSKTEKVTVTGNMTFYANWVKTYAVNLNADGGTGVPATVYLKLGENVKDALSAYVPTKDGLVFGAWFDGTRELAASTKMSSTPLNLTAKYKVEYTVKVFEQNLDNDNYTEVTPSVKGYAYVGEVYSPEIDRTGFELSETASNVTSLTLNADKSKNAYTFYFDRKTFRVHFLGNYDGAPTLDPIKAKYGEQVDMSYDLFAREGYAMMGWAKTTTGDVVYASNLLETLSRNVTGTPATVNKLTVDGNVTLFAVWESAYTNMLGGNDYLFVPDLTTTDAYLVRGGVYFKGEYDDYEKEASFRNNGKRVFSCRINSDHTFAYYDPSRAELEYFLYSGGTQLDRKTSIRFDEYNGIVLVENRSQADEKISVGTYLKKGEDYEVTFTYGPRSGEKMYIRMSSVKLGSSSVEQNVFRIRNDEEMNLGGISRCLVYNGAERQDLYGLLVSYGSMYELTLSGFGTAQMTTPEGTVNYFYEKEEDVLTLTNSITSAKAVVKLIHPNGSNKYGYIDYYEEMDSEFKTADEKASLKLDGIYSATFTDEDGTKYSANYTFTESIFGGFVVTLHLGTGDRSFVVLKNEKTAGDDIISGTDTPTEVTYELQVKVKGYAEYYFRHKDPDSGVVGTYIAPVLVLNDTAEGVAGFYGLESGTTERNYIRMAHGNYSAVANKAYQYAITDIVKDEDTDRYGMFNIYELSNATFSFENYMGLNSYYFISAINTENREITGFSRTYTNGNDSIILTSAGFYIAYLGGEPYHGTYEEEDDIVKASATFLDTTEELCFKLGNGTYTRLDSTPYKAYLVKASMNDYERNTYISFSGVKDGDNYVASFYENGVKICDGYVKDTGYTTVLDSNVNVYQFVADGFMFKYIKLQNYLVTVYSPYNDKYKGGDDFYTSKDGELVLDGYGYKAEYVDKDSKSYSGRYYIYEENVVTLKTGDKTYYFDVTADGFTKRGDEYGTYALTDNHSFVGTLVTLDGYGKAEVFTLNDAGDKTYIDNNATYVADADWLITIEYKTAGGSVTYTGKFGVLKQKVGEENYTELTKLYSQVVMSYVNDDDWTVLVLKDNGAATLYDSKGNVQSGTYELITDDLLFFEDISDAENGFVFRYNVTAGTIAPIKNTSRGYYTTELDSLIFSKAGFAVFNNGERYYYTVSNNNITLYKKDFGNANAGAYGFVQENFGSFTEEIVYNGKTYRSNNGYSIEFIREDRDDDKLENGKFKYLVPVSANGTDITKEEITEISFAPSGESKLDGVMGTAKIGSTEYTCYFYKETDDLGQTQIYAAIGDFRIYFEDVCFYGVDTFGTSLSTFRVKGVSRITEYYAYKFIDGYYHTYISQGALAARNYLENDNYGMLYMGYEYDENGDVTSSYVDAEFGELTGVYDFYGNLVKLEHQSYEYNESNDLNRVVLESGGYTYRLYFGLAMHSVVRATGYYIYGFTREETIETQDGKYRVTIERYIASDNESKAKGSFMNVGLKVRTDEKDDAGEYIYETVKLSGGITNTGKTYFVSRTFEQVDSGEGEQEGKKTDGKLLSSTYYRVELTEKENTSLENVNAVGLYEAVSVTRIDMTVYVSADGKSYLETFEDGKIIVFNFEGTNYFVETYEYDENTKTYTITATDGGEYTIKLGDSGVAEFTHVTKTDDQAGART